MASLLVLFLLLATTCANEMKPVNPPNENAWVWTRLLNGSDNTFFSQVYQHRMHVFQSSLAGLSGIDAWSLELQQPSDFMARYWTTLLGTAKAASLRDAKGKEVAFPDSSWQEFQQDFFSDGMSMVVRREHMGWEDEPLEAAIKATLRSSGATTHAYLSAGQAHALEPHVDP